MRKTTRTVEKHEEEKHEGPRNGQREQTATMRDHCYGTVETNTRTQKRDTTTATCKTKQEEKQYEQ